MYNIKPLFQNQTNLENNEILEKFSNLIKDFDNVYPVNYNNKPVTLNYILNHVNKLTKDNAPNGRTDGLTESAELIRNFLQNNIKPVQETKRSEIPDNEFGIPQERKYPLDTESHVRSAVKMFNYVEPKYEEQLARAVIKKMKKFGIKDMKISKENRLYKYINESSLTDAKQCKYCGSNNIIKIETMFYGQQAYKCVDCNEILGTVPDPIHEATLLIRSLTKQLYDFTEV